MVIGNYSVFCLPAMAEWEVTVEEEEYGPPNLLKDMKTPFSGVRKVEDDDDNATGTISLGAISLTDEEPSTPARPSRSLSTRLIPPTFYLPERMQLGIPAHMTIKGKAGYKIAIAMADSNEGASSIYGNTLRLGADRKVVAVGVIPKSGVLEVAIGTPIQGDLIGESLYFEAAVWSANDMSDTTIARVVSPSGADKDDNSVTIADIPKEKKTGLKFVPDSVLPFSQRRSGSLSSGQP